MSKSKVYSKDEYKDASELEDETMDDRTEDEDEYRTVNENEDELVTEDKDEHVAGEPVAEDEEEDVEEPRDEVEDRTRPKVSIQHGKRGTRSIKSRSRNKGGAPKSTVWNHFDTKTAKYPGHPVCRKCNALFLTESGISTVRRHLSSHKIAAPKLRQRTIHDYCTDPHPKKEQEERNKLVGIWVVCDNQPFSV